MRHIKLIRQHDDKDCGAACLAMILGHYGRKLPMAAVRRAIQVDRYGASIYGLLEGAQKNGLKATALRGSTEDVWMAMQDGAAACPLILRIVNRKGLEHYVVADGFKKNRLRILDPDLGRGQIDRTVFEQSFLGELVLFEKTDDFEKADLRKGSFWKYIRLILGQKTLLLTICFFSILSTGIGLVGTFLFQYLIDHVLGAMDTAAAVEERLQTLAVLMTGLGIIYLLKVGMEVLRGRASVAMRRNIDLPLILGFHSHMTGLPMQFFDTRRSGEVLSRFEDAGRIRDGLSGAMLTLMVDTVMTVVTGAVLWQTSRSLFRIALTITLLSMAVSLLYMRPIDRHSRRLMQQNEQFDGWLKETVDGMETIKVSHAEGPVREKTADSFRSLLDAGVAGSTLVLGKEAVLSGIGSIGMLVLLWKGAVDIAYGTMTVGLLITFVSMLDYFLSPMQNLLGLQDDIQSVMIAAERLNDVLDQPVEGGGTVIPEAGLHTVALRDVTFRYGTRARVLNGLTITGEKGRRIALVGESGCGKSTVARLLQGLYGREEGELEINGIPIEEIPLSWLRRQIACVPQETFLFADTIRNNLLLGLPEAERPDDAEILRVLDACCCGFVQDLAGGLDAMLEARGVNLSGGQRQRLAIARALLRRPGLLILDEATSALDATTERRIQQMLAHECADMLVVVIAHRLSTVRDADCIYVLAHGQVIESGTHTELLQRQGSYAELWNLQGGNAV